MITLIITETNTNQFNATPTLAVYASEKMHPNAVTLVNSNPPTLDIYFVRNDDDQGVYFPETTLGTKQAEIINLILSGEYDEADQVICVNLGTGTSKDVTDDFVQAAIQHLINTNASSDEYPEMILGFDMSFEIDAKQAEEACDARHYASEVR